MKRLMPSTLTNWLMTNPPCNRADLFAVTLRTGTTFYATSGTFDIAVPTGTSGMPAGWVTQTFSANSYGLWTRGAITSEGGSNFNTNSMTLTCVTQQGTTFPGLDAGVLNAAVNGLYEMAQVIVYTAYMPLSQYGNVSYGIETKWFGFISEIKDIGRNQVTFDCRDPLAMLNLKVPRRLFQTNCPWSFCDTNCGLSKANYTVAFTAASGSTQGTLIPQTTFTQAAGYFSQGVVTCTAGNNAGLSGTVKLHDGSGHLQMAGNWFLPVGVGDTFTVLKGCDHTLQTCKAVKDKTGATTDNSARYGGTDFMPVPYSAM